MDQRLGLPPGTVFARSGVSTRYSSTDESAAELAVRACEQALNHAGLVWDDIDCLVATSATMDQAIPFNAAMILAQAGARSRPIAAFDVGASCLSFLTGLDTISYLVEAGRYQHVMLVSADIATFSLDWRHLHLSAIFGDGAAAAIIRRSEPDESSTLLASHLQTFAEGADHCRILAGGSRYHPDRTTQSIRELAMFHMDGLKIFKLAARELPRFTQRLLDAAGLTLSDFDVVVPHQASRLAIDHLRQRLHIEKDRLVDVFERFGNQVGASLPTALHEAISGGQVQRGQRVLLIGSGAGMTLGGAALVY
ncbi:3-oxoacyl-[acyl-carrier-protein] synthase III C-terminal domain-containing protein [Roseateles amylovorans]|uniref:3-oxoacyl-ACP synthase n=1 Tax=Roseateles amylovorans TaxID=2978473 RepID=A0ABY6B3D9_9BURK|nr:3-oxoacyl-[acyl-carrier-protein] synthase III C-terminal domain-containing protein [Roseateles amylovorans]UXH77795.1 3-oxoacyl-ACP synthase [Roseateles amylovorans]